MCIRTVDELSRNLQSDESMLSKLIIILNVIIHFWHHCRTDFSLKRACKSLIQIAKNLKTTAGTENQSAVSTGGL